MDTNNKDKGSITSDDNTDINNSYTNSDICAVDSGKTTNSDTSNNSSTCIADSKTVAIDSGTNANSDTSNNSSTCIADSETVAIDSGKTANITTVTADTDTSDSDSSTSDSSVQTVLRRDIGQRNSLWRDQQDQKQVCRTTSPTGAMQARKSSSSSISAGWEHHNKLLEKSGIRKDKPFEVDREDTLMKSYKNELPSYRRVPLVKYEFKNLLSGRGRALLERLKQSRKNHEMIGFESDIRASMFFEPMSLQEKLDHWMSTIPKGAEQEGVCSARGQHRHKSDSSPDVEADNFAQTKLNDCRNLDLPISAGGDDARDHSNMNILGTETLDEAKALSCHSHSYRRESITPPLNVGKQVSTTSAQGTIKNVAVDPSSLKFCKVYTSTSISNKLQLKPVYTTDYKDQGKTEGINMVAVAHSLLSLDTDCPPAKKMKYYQGVTMDYKMMERKQRSRTFRRRIHKKNDSLKWGKVNVNGRDATISRSNAGTSYFKRDRMVDDQKFNKSTMFSAGEEVYKNIASELVRSVLRKIVKKEEEAKGHIHSNNSVASENHTLNVKQTQMDETTDNSTPLNKLQTYVASDPRNVRLKECQISSKSASHYGGGTTSQAQPITTVVSKEKSAALTEGFKDTSASSTILSLQKNTGLDHEDTESSRGLSASVNSTFKEACEEFERVEKHNKHKDTECSVFTPMHETSETDVFQSFINDLLNIIEEEGSKGTDMCGHCDGATTSQVESITTGDSKEKSIALTGLKDNNDPPLFLSLQRNKDPADRKDSESSKRFFICVDPTLKEACEEFDGVETHNKHKNTECTVLTPMHETLKTNVCQSVINDLLNVLEGESLKVTNKWSHRDNATTCSRGEHNHLRHYAAPVTKYSFEINGDHATTHDGFGQGIPQLESFSTNLQITKASARDQQPNEMYANEISPSCQKENSIQERKTIFDGNALDDVFPKTLQIFSEENKCLQNKELILKVGGNEPKQGNKNEIRDSVSFGTIGLSAESKTPSSLNKRFIELKKLYEDTPANGTLGSTITIFNQELSVLDREKKKKITKEKLLRDDESNATFVESTTKYVKCDGLEITKDVSPTNLQKEAENVAKASVSSQSKYSWKKLWGKRSKNNTDMQESSVTLPTKDKLQDISPSVKVVSSPKKQKRRCRTNLAICFPLRCVKPSDSFCQRESCQRPEQESLNKENNENLSPKEKREG